MAEPVRKRSEESGAGRVKTFLGVATTVLSAVGGLTKLSDDGHALVSTIIFAFFAVHVATDILWWRGHPWVWICGPLTVAVAAYWWVGFMALRGFPDPPILPTGWYPPFWAYYLMAGWLGAYAVWDIVDARLNRYRDEKTLVAGAIALLIGVCVCLFLTIRGPLRG